MCQGSKCWRERKAEPAVWLTSCPRTAGSPCCRGGCRGQGSARGLEAIADPSVQSRAAAGLGRCDSDSPCAILCSCQDVSPDEAAAEPVGVFPHPQKREMTAHAPGQDTSWPTQDTGNRVSGTCRCRHRHCVRHHRHRRILHQKGDDMEEN